MPLTEDNVTTIAKLAHLELPIEQSKKTLDQLNAVFKLVETMQAVDTKGVMPLRHPVELAMQQVACRMRDDRVTETNRRDDYLRCAPESQEGLFLVPKVVE
jgi:aspartyl-tRNA(Asn)/glutamyl-tRNA(Gln) amidotransferase subunit C